MTYLMGTGPLPRLPSATPCGASRKDDPTWEFEFGLDCVLDGIAKRLGI